MKLQITILFLFLCYFTNKLYAQNPNDPNAQMYIRFDSTDPKQKESNWRPAASGRLVNHYRYDYYIYCSKPLWFICPDKSTRLQENIPISQLPTNIRTMQEFQSILETQTNAQQAEFWEAKPYKWLIVIASNGQTFSKISVVLQENIYGEGKIIKLD